MTPTVSIIVPVYNVENYLVKCVNSILNQTLDNIEIILINDGSTDSSGEICNDFARIDERVSVIHQKNGGLSDARNTGLDVAKGKFVAFVDSDDYIHKDMYRLLVKTIEESECDIAEAGYKEVFEDTPYDDKVVYDDKVSKRTYSGKSAIASTIMDHDCRNYVWNKLYKRELWKHSRFPYGKLFEDVFTTYKIVEKASKVVKIDSVLYYYFQRSNSIVNSSFSIRKLDHCEALEEMMLFIEKKYPELAPITCIKFFSQCLPNLQELIVNRKKIENANFLINQLLEKLFDKRFEAYLRLEIEELCIQVLGGNYNFFLKQKKLIRLKMFFLKKSIWLFYIFNKCFEPMKDTVKKLTA
ncbi:glycosyltransferase [Priestia megaterium]|uniref:glycosyltransferase n=1 Tax=Priestia megaterium TaxID=1404 RepID=UPI001C245EF3|nr:glycosyltransferase [Priestia megaterium]MBU8586943.1 glycosyltransferase [Priestia megaterium]